MQYICTTRFYKYLFMTTYDRCYTVLLKICLNDEKVMDWKTVDLEGRRQDKEETEKTNIKEERTRKGGGGRQADKDWRGIEGTGSGEG